MSDRDKDLKILAIDTDAFDKMCESAAKIAKAFSYPAELLGLKTTNMNLQCIAEHTVDLSLINRQSKVLDLGCRAFSWSKAMLEYVDKVYCVDADRSVQSDSNRLPLLHASVSDTDDKPVHFITHGNGTGNFILRDGRAIPARYKVQQSETATLSTIINSAFGGGMIDLIKMDIEGEEIPVLLSLKEPPARQLSVEFHMHTGTSEAKILFAIQKMKALYYDVAYVDKSEKHGCGMNYWDVLFKQKPVIA
jgi:hypothetical protein